MHNGYRQTYTTNVEREITLFIVVQDQLTWRLRAQCNLPKSSLLSALCRYTLLSIRP